MKNSFEIVKFRKFSFAFSAFLVGISIVLLAVYGLKPGIDFTGGSLVEFEFQGDRPSNQELVEVLQDYKSVVVQPVDEKGVLIKMQFINEEEHKDTLSKIRENFETEDNRILEQRFETIGPVISTQLKNRSIYIILTVIVTIVLYVAYAFRKVSRPVQSWKYGISAIIALVHDVVITFGTFAILGKFLGVEVDIAFVVALMTILGYSVNDTIVVFDRVRENLIKKGSDKFVEAINEGVSQTVARSINTSLTTLLVLIALFLFGGDSIHYFSLALIVGIVAGTYSSIFLAAPLLATWQDISNRKR
ncbi:MAG: protein translocase subunit SecF [Candidatus Magasanikbacteria bacterium CG_4_9_14_3_um_filter_32_9]|uniref:Protein-export membrane protein SecF n=1 Tax=Candidatus Magasanikbacteria bacterium CG_4_9_14_3_um_filter_32_9 TaxID=1974644 RepID=A0A2M7Z6A6_9BACT|nr:MAG: protein translocase subunit SecF [Candidatus Magasanikbacteria bacterium CG_4_9_14_3_um_filter_32_9]